MPGPTSLWLMRPADTAWDVDRRLRGATDLPAMEDSLRELRDRVARLDEGPDVLIHAPDDAAAESARVVASRFACGVRADRGLRDPDLGLLEGLGIAEFERRFERRFAEWIESPLTAVPPEGEPLSDARARILDAFAAALDRHEGRRLGLVVHDFALATVRDALARGDGSALWSRVEGRGWCTRHVLPEGAAAALGD
ncbi:MAG: histidine phosphatase family protein [Phycisphaerales bacterium]|nr:histidine phosphatase family protein [Phycisphaerales bacterium]